MCLEEAFLPPVRNCTILSFGVDDELNFEDEMMEAFECRNYLFDPSSPYAENQTREETPSGGENYYYPIGASGGTVDVDGLTKILKRLSAHIHKIHFIKIDVWGEEWKVLRSLLELQLIEVTQQLSFSSHLSFLKNSDVAQWRHKLQGLMDILTALEERGLKKVLYKEVRSSLSSIQFPHDDIPRPSCGRFLYLRYHS